MSPDRSFMLVHVFTRIKYYSTTITVTVYPSEKISVYRSPDCLSRDSPVFPSGKGLVRGKKEIIFRLAPLPGTSLSLALLSYSTFSEQGGTGGGRDPGQWMRKKKLNRSRRVEGTPDVSLIEMESSACVFFNDNNAKRRSLRRARENAGNACCCFLFVFPSSEVIDEFPPPSPSPSLLLNTPVSVNANHDCWCCEFYTNVTTVTSATIIKLIIYKFSRRSITFTYVKLG